MKNHLLTFVFCMLALCVWAQERTITGVVKDDSGPVPGVNILLKGTTQGVVSDIDGIYKIIVPESGGTLVFSSIGFVTEEVEIGNRSVINIALIPDVKQLSEVVVTALGVEREKKALGYSVQEIEGKELSKGREVNIVNGLAGKIAGVTVNSSSGAPGASSRIVIRGNSSLLGNNQPLFVIDGIPIDNTQFSSSARNNTNEPSNGIRLGDEEQGAADYGNAAQDIDPNNIESLSVLKGPTAVALYGSRAQNGAVIITTKNGKGQEGIGVTFSTAYSVQTPLRLPNFQNSYGQGGYGLVDYPDYLDVDESWGDPLDVGTTKRNVFNEDVPWVSNPDNVKDFMETGHNFTNNISIQGSNEVANFRLSISDLDQKGIMPGTGFDKTNFGLNAGMQVSDKLRADVSVNYSITEGQNRPSTGYDGANALQQMFNWHGRQVRWTDFRNYKDADGNLILNLSDPNNSQSFNKPISPTPAWQNNPYADLLENVNSDRRDRLIGNFKVSYKILDWLDASVRAGTDYYEDSRLQRYKSGLDNPPPLRRGGFIMDNYTVNTFNVDFVLNATKNFGENISTNLLIGANRYDLSISNEFTRVQGLLVPDIYNLSNALGTPEARNYVSEKRINGLYFSGQVGYKNMLFLDITGRNDWSSTLPADNRSYFYPSVSTSFVFTDAFEIPIISYGKIRAGVAQVGNDTNPYNTESFFVAKRITNNQADITFPFNGAPSFALGDQLANESLKPEETTSWEIGTDLRFFDGRFNVDFTYYNSITKNQLLALTLPSSSGFSSQFVNAGEIQNNGVELMLSGTPLSFSNGLQWDVIVNFAKNNSEVTELHSDVESIIIERHRAQTEARPGRPYGDIYGTAWLRNEAGQRIINPNDGLPSRAPGGNQLLGNITPDFTMGLSNTISFKGLSLNFLLDWKKGGDLFSITEFFGGYSGVLERTVEGRDGTYVAEGVIDNGDGTFSPNTIQIDAEDYWHNSFQAQEEGVYDASFIKLREVILSYNFPKSLVSKTPFTAINFSLIGRNLAILHSNVPNIDPESSAYGASNGQGFEVNNIPSVRSFGASLRVDL
ncbi:SusC/RagA family TonB-linked outer membrane protein [Fulvivirgaceae bacterium BMA12]|uniref:SusC/RagA family TonB-linked outer membrane protein n=1 Tax=Agaribacillus aureus TaxID=3051825 RepID=A0ABT8L940_9BACT|nr:SusC/RagA family TonB-linked outer membrane protein [Fulvivirgaceae bacterium BMA12]